MSVSSPRTSGRFEEAEPAAIEEDGPKTSSRPSSALCGRFDDEVNVHDVEFTNIYIFG